MDQLKMYIFINSDLGMSPGKIASQVGHIVHIIVDELVRNGYEIYPPTEEYMNYAIWSKNCTKIVLKATTSELNELKTLNNARYFIDSGQTTQIEPNSLTVVGFFPGYATDEFVKKYKLL